MREISPILSCPDCRYLWRGLPDEGRCPECGFRYSPELRVWVESKFIRFLAPILLLAQGVCHGLMTLNNFYTSGPAGLPVPAGAPPPVPVRWDFVIVGASFAVLALAIGLWTLWYARLRVFLAVDQDGVRVRNSIKVRAAAWNRIRKIVRGATYISFHVVDAKKIVVNRPLISTAHDDFIEEAMRRWEAQRGGAGRVEETDGECEAPGRSADGGSSVPVPSGNSSLQP